ncbi:MAG: TPM domain-containing protein, partial [Cyanobacteria bacterium P01_E01_bin.42]
IQRSLIFFLLCLSLLGISQPVLAIPIHDIPNPKVSCNSWVMDKADILRPVIEKHLDREISQLERANGSEIAIVTVPDTEPEATPKEFATKLFNTWGIGEQEKNNGVLFLISQGDRRVEIETGTDLGEILPDREVGEIIQQKIIPDFQQGQFERGTVAGTEALIKILLQRPSHDRLAPISSLALVWFIFIVFAIVMTALSTIVQKKRNERGSWESGSSGDGGIDFGGSSGGGGFGGGCSDGGGAGGHW